MSKNEAETRRYLIDPSIEQRGWDSSKVKVEQSMGAITSMGGRAMQGRKRSDYMLRIEVTNDTQPIAVALIEAKAEARSPGFGLEQAKLYSKCNLYNTKFIFSTNGHEFVEYDKFSGITTDPRPLSEFPTPDDLRRRYEAGMGFCLNSEAAKPLLVKYTGGEAERRYYQDAAIRAVFEHLAIGGNRALLSLATGAGKTFIAVNLLKRLTDAGQVRKALFICDRDELREQANAAFASKFGTNAAIAKSGNPEKNARVIIATYQTLGIARDDDDASFLLKHYPTDYFSHIIIDECHRSAWGKWSQVLLRNENAVQIGLTATPRSLIINEKTEEALNDARITADNIRYFGEPVYEYTYFQAVEDGYLAACEIQAGLVNLDSTGLSLEEIMERSPRNYITGEPVTEDELKEQYEKTDYEAKIMLPDRVFSMCKNLFDHLVKSGGPHQKTIIFCVRDIHAEIVANEINNLYTAYCAAYGESRASNYAFKCTYAAHGSSLISDMRGSKVDYFIAATVDLLSTGVDIPAVQNIVFFRYMRSPVSFHQMIGRGTRLSENKLMFTIYDYTDATRLFGEEFLTKLQSQKENGGAEPPAQPLVIQVDGFHAVTDDTGRYVVVDEDGEQRRVSVDEYKQGLARKILQNSDTIEVFMSKWIVPSERRKMLDNLVAGGYSPEIVRQVERMTEYDLYDVIAEIAYGASPKKLSDRAYDFTANQRPWYRTMPIETQNVIIAIASQFAKEGSDLFENPHIFEVDSIRQAGGIAALKKHGNPNVLLTELKRRLFAA